MGGGGQIIERFRRVMRGIDAALFLSKGLFIQGNGVIEQGQRRVRIALLGEQDDALLLQNQRLRTVFRGVLRE